MINTKQIKVSYNNEIKRANIPSKIEELVQEICLAFNITLNTANSTTDFTSPFIIYYIDEEDDKIYISNQYDLDQAQSFMESRDNKNIFKLFVSRCKGSCNIGTKEETLCEFKSDKCDIKKEKEAINFTERSQQLSRIIHDSKNSLVSIIKSLKYLLSKNNTDDTNELLKYIKGLTKYLLVLNHDSELANDESYYLCSHIYPTNILLIDLMEEIKEIVEPLIIENNLIKNLKFIVNIDKSIAFFRSDGPKLKQLLINLISNSIKFTKISGNGYIELRYQNVTTDINSIKKIMFSVIDTGFGIPPETQKLLFDPETKEICLDDNMIGANNLALVKKLCSMLGSRVTFSDNNPSGCIFKFTLPEIPETKDKFDM